MPPCRRECPPGRPAPDPGRSSAFLAGAYRLGKRPIRQLAFDPLGLTTPVGMIRRLGRQSAAELEAPVEELRRDVRRAAAAHIDETSWWRGQDEMWLRTAVTRLETVSVIAPSRGGDVARATPGTDGEEVVVRDRLASDGRVRRRQLRWAHPKRDLRAMVDRGGESAEVGRLLPGHCERLFDWRHRVRDGRMARATRRSEVAMMRLALREGRRGGVRCGLAETAGTCRGLLAGGSHLWAFVRVEGAEPTSDAAGGALRHGVIPGGISGGTEGEAGGRFVGGMLWVVATRRQPQQDVLDDLTRCYGARLDGRAIHSLPTTQNFRCSEAIRQ